VRATTRRDTDRLLLLGLLLVVFLTSVYTSRGVRLTTWGGVQAPGFHERPPYGEDFAPVLTLCTTGVPYALLHERGPPTGIR